MAYKQHVSPVPPMPRCNLLILVMFFGVLSSASSSQPFVSSIVANSAETDTAAVIPGIVVIEAVPTHPHLFLVGTITGKVSLLHLKRRGNRYWLHRTLNTLSTGAGRSVFGISADPFKPRAFYISSIALQWRAQGLGSAGWQNGKVLEVEINPSGTAITLTRTVASGLPASPGFFPSVFGTAVNVWNGRLYIGIGSFTNAGVPSPTYGNFASCLASSSILEIDVRSADKTRALTWSSDNPAVATITTPTRRSGISIYATGFRSIFSPVVASDRRLYVIDAGGEPKYGEASVTCDTSTPLPKSLPDRLLYIRRGKWYGHANRRRGSFDKKQCTFIWTGREAVARTVKGFTPPVFDMEKAAQMDVTPGGLTGLTEYTPAWIPSLKGMLFGVQTIAEAAPIPKRGIISIDRRQKTVKRVADLPGLGLTVDAYGSVVVAQFAKKNIGVAVPKRAFLYPAGRRAKIGSVFPARGLPGTRIFIAGTNLPKWGGVRVGGFRCKDVRRKHEGDIELVSCVVPHSILLFFWPRMVSVSVGYARMRRAFMVLNPYVVHNWASVR